MQRKIQLHVISITMVQDITFAYNLSQLEDVHGKSIGPRMEPWGTPEVTVAVEEQWLPMLTENVLSVR